MPALSEAQFKQTLVGPMRQLPAESEPPFDFWAYIEAIPSEDFEGCKCEGDITYVWESSDGAFQHVLLNSQDKNIFMVIVLAIPEHKVLGHRMLNFNELYGVTEA